MFQLIIGLLLVATLMIFWGQLNNAEIHIAPILGFAFAALYSSANFEDEEITEYTLQCCIFIVSLTVIWQKPING